MRAIGVAERGDEVQTALRAYLRTRGAKCAVLPCRARTHWTLLLCADAEALPPHTRAALLCAADRSAPAASARCRAGTLLTCGLDPRCSLTPSSLREQAGLAALRRELPLPDGSVRLPCEIALPPGGTTETRLLLAAAALVLFPEE